MKHVLVLAFLITGALAQNTAKYPASVATEADLGIASNRAETTLTAGITSTATSLPVLSGTPFKPGMFASIDNEFVAVCAASGNTITVGKSTCPNVDGRGLDVANGGGSAASHLAGAKVQARISAWHHNQVAAEVRALESYAGGTMNVLSFAGVDASGVSDSTAGIQEAIDAAAAAGRGLYFPPGTYKNSGLTYPAGTKIRCESRESTVLLYTGTETALAPSIVETNHYLELKNCSIQRASSPNVGTAVDLQGVWKSEISGNEVRHFGIGFDANGDTVGCYFNSIERNHTYDTPIGIYLHGGDAGQESNHNTVKDNRFADPNIGIKCTSHCTGNIFFRSDMEGATDASVGPGAYGAYITGNSNIITGSWIEYQPIVGETYTGILLRGQWNLSYGNINYAISNSLGGTVNPIDSIPGANTVFEPGLYDGSVYGQEAQFGPRFDFPANALMYLYSTIRTVLQAKYPTAPNDAEQDFLYAFVGDPDNPGGTLNTRFGSRPSADPDSRYGYMDVAVDGGQAAPLLLNQSGGRVLIGKPFASDDGKFFQVQGNTSIDGSLTASGGGYFGGPTASAGTWINDFASASNDEDSTAWYQKWGADVSLGPLLFFVKGHPSATGNNRYVALDTFDAGGTRELRLQPLGGTVRLGPGGIKAGDGSTGVTSATCSAWKNGLCVAP